ncbi:hypothetical protein QEN19_001565 [Hanseniaspora menglaensis]
MSENSLDSLDYDPLRDIKDIFANQEYSSEFSLGELINTTKLYKNHLYKNIDDLKVKNKKSTKSEIKIIPHETLVHNFKDLSSSIDAFHSKNISLMKNLNNIQTSKKNLNESIKYFSTLETVKDEYKILNDYLKAEDYIQVLPIFENYSQHLAKLSLEYKNVVDLNDINRFNGIYDKLELKCKTYTKQLFDDENLDTNSATADNSPEINGSSRIDISQQQFQSLLKIIDLFQDKTILNSIQNWIIDNNLLFEFKQIFNVDEIEVTSLENLDRRFIFFKKILTSFMSKYEDGGSNWFPSEFKLSLKLTKRFCELTAEDLEIILKREFNSVTSSVENDSSDLFISSLEKCLEFEKYVKLKFKNQLISEDISCKFKPYISIWIKKQEDMISKKVKQYLSDPKMDTHGSKDMIIPSSMDLFRTYKNILNESLQLITPSIKVDGNEINNNDKIFEKLAKIYYNGIELYEKQIIDPVVVRNYKEAIENTKLQDIIEYTILVINTCDYLVTTIDDLSSKLQDYCQKEKYKINIDDLLSKNKQSLIKLINFNINSVLMNEIISKEIEFVFKEFLHVNWSKATSNVVTNRYISSLSKILSNEKSSSLLKASNLFYKEIYIYNLFDKVVNHIIRNLIECMVKILSNKAISNSDSIIKLWSIDIPEVIEFLIKFPTIQINNITATNSGMKRSAETTKKELNNKLGNFVKLLNSDIENYTEKFIELTFNCDNSVVWLYMLKLKEYKDINQIVNLWNKQAVDKSLKADSNNWFIFNMSDFLQDGFIDYNNNLYFESIKVKDSIDLWNKFLSETIKISEFKKSSTTQKRVISPLVSNDKQQLQQQGLQQKIGMFWNSM